MRVAASDVLCREQLFALLSDMSRLCGSHVFLSAILPARTCSHAARAVRLAEVVVYLWHMNRCSVQSNFVLQSQSVHVPC